MLCTEFGLVSSILSTVLFINTTYNGTDVKEGTPVLYYEDMDVGHGVLDITLPQELAVDTFQWNDTTEDGIVVTRNVTLRDHAFRLKVGIAHYNVMVNISMESITLHLAISPINITADREAGFYHGDNLDEWILDFIIPNDTSLLANETMVISMPYTWQFKYYEPDYFPGSIYVTLTPFDWSDKEAVTYSDSYLFDSFNLTNSSLGNLTSLYPEGDQFAYLSDLVLKDYCVESSAELNVSYDVIQAYNGLLNCSMCLQPSYEARIESDTSFNVIQAGASLGCVVQSIGPNSKRYAAGDVLEFEFTIVHNWWAVENATDVKIELDSRSYCILTDLNVSTPLANGTMDHQIVQPLFQRYYTIELSLFHIDHTEVSISGRCTLADSLPLQSEELTIMVQTDWTSTTANGHRSKGLCYGRYKSDSIDVTSAASYLQVPAEWGLGVPAEAFASFSMPAGTIEDVSLDIYLSYDIDLMGVVLGEGRITVSDSSVFVSEPLNVAGPTSRRRRAVSNSQISVRAGTVVNPASRAAPATVNISMTFYPTGFSQPSAPVQTSAALSYAGQQALVGTTISSSTVGPLLNITKETQYGSTSRRSIKVKLTIEHLPTSTGSAYNVVILDAEKGFNIDSSNGIQSVISYSPPSIKDVGFYTNGGVRLAVKEFNQTAGPIIISFEAEALGDKEFPEGTHSNDAILQYSLTSLPTAVGAQTVEQRVSSCTTRKDIESDSLFYKHGITAAVIIVGFILGILLVPLVIFIVLVIMKKTKGGFGSSVKPSATDYRSISKQKEANALLLDAGQKLKQGFNSSVAAADDSIVSILALRDRLTANRELDNLDIQATVEVDKRMESERIKSMDDVLNTLLLGMVRNGDITRQQYDHQMTLFRKSVKELDIRLVAEYNSAIDDFTRRQATHNRSKLGSLLDKQRADKNELLNTVEVSGEEQKELMKSVDAQCQIEQDDLSYRLKLEQDEEAEKIRKEFSLKKRIQTKELQQSTLKELQAKTEMPEEMASWLMKEHAKNVAHLEKIHDDELCRQKLVLEEKLAKRRALAELSDLEEKNQSELLNTIAGGQMDILKKAKKQKLLSGEEARGKSEEIMADLMKYKQGMEVDMAKQEAALHSKLSEQKKKRLAAKIKDQENELVAFDKDCQRQEQEHQKAGGSLNPLAVAEERLQLVAKHEIDRASSEIQIDQENATELKELRSKMSQTYKNRLMEREKRLLEELRSDGLRDDQMEAILEEHNSDIETLEARQKQSFEQQDENLKQRLKKRRRDWEKRMAQEQEEKAQLREQEATVVREIIDSQFTMSVDEREKIMREHEKNMIKLENSLTLNKLKQRQLLEEKLAERRAKRMEQLEQEQMIAAKKNEKRHSDDDEEDRQMAALQLLKSQAEERVAVLTEEDAETNFEEEMEKVKLEILQQRAVALREQEDRLGGMVAQLQINKAKELTEIDEKQRAINELKANLIDDLNDRGVMSDVEAEQCLDQHRAQQEKLTRKLDNEREKQEKMLKKKLADRLQSREKTLLDGYEDRLKEVLEKSPNKIAARLKKAAVLHKRSVAIEEFKARMEKEISQSLEEMRREHNIKKAKLIQELELRFIASLVHQGKLKRSELKDSLKMLFPAKTDKQLEELINTLHDDKATVEDDEKDLLNTSHASMLKERIARSVSMYQGSPLGPLPEEPKQLRPKSSKKKSIPSPLSLDYTPESPGKQRLPPLKPIGASRRGSGRPGSGRPQANSENF